MAILELKDVTVRFGGLTAVNQVSCQLDENKIVSIIGPNGAGKTTVFNAITGIYEPTSGSIKFAGHELIKPASWRLALIALLIGLTTALAALLATINVDLLWQAAIKRNYTDPGKPFSYRAAWQSAVDYSKGRLGIIQVRGERWAIITADGKRTLAYAADESQAKSIRDQLDTLVSKITADPELIALAAGDDDKIQRGDMAIVHDGTMIRYVQTTDAGEVELAQYDSPETAQAALESLATIGRERTIRKRNSGLALIFGFVIGIAGTYAVWNRSRRSPDFISRAGIARTFQNIRLFQNTTVLENVLTAMDRRFKAGVFRMALRTPTARREEATARTQAIDWLKLVGLESRSDMLAKNLSYGEQRKLEIARALATQPRVLLLDEPAAGMNPTESAELAKLIARIRQRGFSILLIEHHMRVVMGISDRIAVLDYGSKIADGTPAEVRANPAVIKAYLGDEEET